MPRREDDSDIFLRQRPALLRYAAHLTGSQSEAEDVMQEAWLRFHAVGLGRQLSEPEGYLRRIVRNLVFDNRRRRSLERRLFESDTGGHADVLPSEQPSALAEVAARQELQLVLDIVAAMPERMRLAFEMHRFQGLKLFEIAAQLSISKSSAHELVVEGVQRCKRGLQGRR